MTKKKQAQFRYCQSEKQFDVIRFRAVTEYSSLGSKKYKWRDNMEPLLKQKDDLEVRLTDAVKVIF